MKRDPDYSLSGLEIVIVVLVVVACFFMGDAAITWFTWLNS